MRIQITAVERRGPDLWATFTAEVGEGRGRWRSAAAPVPGERWDVELDFPEPVRDFRAAPADTATSPARDGDVVTVTVHVLAPAARRTIPSPRSPWAAPSCSWSWRRLRATASPSPHA